MLSGVLGHAMDVLEDPSTASPRKARKDLLALIESVESMLESVDAEWCDGVSRCSRDEIDRLSSLLLSA